MDKAYYAYGNKGERLPVADVSDEYCMGKNWHAQSMIGALG